MFLSCHFLLLFLSVAGFAELKTIREALDRQERNSSGYVEDRVRDIAANMFGVSTMRRFLIKCLYDLVVLSNPHDCSHEDIVSGESQLEVFAEARFVEFVEAFYKHLLNTTNDPSNILVKNSWVVSGKIVVENIKASGGVLNNSQNGMKKRILNALEFHNSIMSPFRRSAGPGLSIIVWCATKTTVVLVAHQKASDQLLLRPGDVCC